MKPIRIQRKRTKGWRLPPNAICVTRPGKWGNPFRVGKAFGGHVGDCVAYFEEWLKQTHEGRKMVADARIELRGKNLACWCKLGAKCHADVLLRIANEPICDCGKIEHGRHHAACPVMQRKAK